MLICSSSCKTELHFPRKLFTSKSTPSSLQAIAISEMPASRWRRMKAISIHRQAALTFHSHSPGQALEWARARKYSYWFHGKVQN